MMLQLFKKLELELQIICTSTLVLVRNVLKHYQEGDIKDGEKNFARRTGEIPPGESESRAAKMLHEQ